MYNLYCSLPEEDGTEKYAYAEACIVTNQMGMEFDTYENQLLMYSEAPAGILGLIKMLFVFFLKFITSFYGIILGAIIAVLVFIFKDKSKKVEIGGGGGGSSSSTSVKASASEVAEAGRKLTPREEWKQLQSQLRMINIEELQKSLPDMYSAILRQKISKDIIAEYKNDSSKVPNMEEIYKRILSSITVLRENITYSKSIFGIGNENSYTGGGLIPILKYIDLKGMYSLGEAMKRDIQKSYSSMSNNPLYDFSNLLAFKSKDSAKTFSNIDFGKIVDNITDVSSIIAAKLSSSEKANWIEEVTSKLRDCASMVSLGNVSENAQLSEIDKSLAYAEKIWNNSKVKPMTSLPNSNFTIDGSKSVLYINIDDGTENVRELMNVLGKPETLQRLEEMKKIIPTIKDRINEQIQKINGLSNEEILSIGHVPLIKTMAISSKSATSVTQSILGVTNQFIRNNQHPIYSSIGQIISNYVALTIARVVYYKLTGN